MCLFCRELLTPVPGFLQKRVFQHTPFFLLKPDTMEKDQILSELNILLRELFRNPTINVTEETRSSDIEEWDSLNHALLVAKVEKHFGVKFKLAEMMTFKVVGNICDTVYKKLMLK